MKKKLLIFILALVITLVFVPGIASAAKCTSEENSDIIHTYETTITQATDSDNGSIVKTCSVCGDVTSTTIHYATTFTLSDTSYTYDGSIKTPAVTVMDSEGNALIQDTDYIVTYESGCIDVGTYTVTVEGIGNYAFTKVLTFTIDPTDITDWTIKLSATNYTYNGSVKTPSVTVKNPQGETLVKDTDYTVTYASGRINAGAYTVTVKGTGKYSFTKDLTFHINAVQVSYCSISLSATSYIYNGSVKTPDVIVKTPGGRNLTQGKSYTLTYASGRKDVGTYTVIVNLMGNYAGSKTLTFQIKPVQVSHCSMSLSATSYIYNGNIKTPDVIVKTPGGRNLTQGKSYTLTYASGRKDVGTYTVKVTLMGNYAGSKTLTFQIKPVQVSHCSISLSATGYTYNGSVKTPGVTVKTPGGRNLTQGKSYTLTYAGGRKDVGAYTVKVTLMGNYAGSKTLTFYVKPTTKASASLVVGQTFHIGAKSNKPITYASSNSSIAKVNSTGTITAVKPGTATITVKSGTVSQAIKVTVETPYVTVSETSSVLLGQAVTLKATTNTGSAVQWSSGNSSIATVSSSGTVTGKKVGTTTIYAKVTYQGKTYTGNYIVTVNPPYLAETSATIDKGDTYQIAVTGGFGTTTYSSSDTSVATVSSDGVVTGLATGSATITVKRNGHSMKFTVQVVVTKIKVGAICYHKFYTQEEADNGTSFGTYTIWAAEFEQHLQYLEEQGIRVITVSELMDFVDGKIDLPEKCVLLTVDDCDISFYKHAYPLLKQYDVKMNAAVIGNRSDGAQAGNAYRKSYSTWDEIAEMAASGYVEFGAHTYYLHDTNEGRTGTMLKSDEGIGTYRNVLKNDLTPLNKKIANYVGYTPNFFVYPYYAVSMPSIPILRDTLGYRFLFCGNSDSAYRYMGESIHATNYNPFTKGEEPASCLIKRYTPRSGDDFAAIIETIFEEG